MTDLRAQIEALRVMVGTDSYVRLSAVLALIPEGPVLVTPAPTEDGRPPLDPLVAAHDRGWMDGYLAGKAAARPIGDSDD
jgi:hypothetical protein